MAIKKPDSGHSPAPEVNPIAGNPQDTPPQDTPPKPDLPEHYRGKSTEELVAIIKEKESQIGKQSSEIGDLRGRFDDLQNQVAYQQQFGGAQREREPQPDSWEWTQRDLTQQRESPQRPNKDTFDWDNPSESVKRVIRDEWQRSMQEANRRDMEIRSWVAKTRPHLAKAKKEAPHLFASLKDEEVEMAIYNSLASNLIHPSRVDDKAYKWAAAGILGEKTNYNYIAPTNINPVQPTATENPVAPKPPEEGEEEPVELDDFGRELLRYRPQGMTEKDFLNKVKQDRGGR